MDFTVTELKKFSDERGFLVEFLKGSELPDDQKAFGQIYLATLQPGASRGNHFHRHKEEYFVVMRGRATVILEDIKTKQRKSLELSAADEKIVRLRVGPGLAHVITNSSDSETVLCDYTNKIYDAKNLDQEKYEIV